jgi:hypothetical protein
MRVRALILFLALLLIVGGVVFTVSGLLLRVPVPGRAVLEPLSAAEERCAHVDPEHPTGSRRSHECIAREMARSPWQPLGGSRFPLMTVGVGLLAAALVVVIVALR